MHKVFRIKELIINYLIMLTDTTAMTRSNARYFIVKIEQTKGQIDLFA